jgi:UDP-2-acetamido-3-amino-2,3-dideoxy-glucuronate N-acetyltransferase
MTAGAFIHPTAIVETESIGRDTRIWAFCHVLEGASIGQRCNIGDHCFVESGAVIGNDVTIKNGNSIWSGVSIEDGVFVAPGVVFTNDRHPRSPRLGAAAARYAGTDWLLPTRVGAGATLGAGSVILAGLTIGAYAFIGAGAIVTSDVPSFALALGNPARMKGFICRCGRQLELEGETAECAGCGLGFRRDGVTIAPVDASRRL